MAGNPLTDPDWAKNTADQVERLVTTVRDKTTSNLAMLARAVVFGTLALILGVAAVVLLLIAATKGVAALAEWPFDRESSVWISYLVIGGILCLSGMLLMRARHSSAE